MMPNMLGRELETYKANRAQLVADEEGRYVLVKDDKLVGVFDTERDAISQGYERFGAVPFLVKRILEFDIPMHFTSRLIAL